MSTVLMISNLVSPCFSTVSSSRGCSTLTSCDLDSSVFICLISSWVLVTMGFLVPVYGTMARISSSLEIPLKEKSRGGASVEVMTENFFGSYGFIK